MKIASYPKIYNLGHAAVTNLLLHPVTVEEKVDGSQFSFQRVDNVDDTGYELRFRSKGANIQADAPPKLFERAVEHIKGIALDLHPLWIYRGEVLDKPKHNVLTYGRTPVGHVILFDITTGDEQFLTHEEKRAEAERIGLETVPRIFNGMVTSQDQINNLMERDSVLGNTKIEGLVFKQRGLFGKDGKTLMGKYVSEKFKEKHNKDWKKENPKQGDILIRLKEMYRVEARWQKSLQTLRDADQLTQSPKDIGPLIKQVQKDLLEEEKEAIKEYLFNWAWPHVHRTTIAGLPEWYKNKLMEKQFEVTNEQGS